MSLLRCGDRGYGTGGTTIFNAVFLSLARVTLNMYLTDKNTLGGVFWRSVAYRSIAD